MSIIIKDMEMPETCDDCVFHRYHSHGDFICVATPLFYPMNLVNSKGIRKDWCPLSEQPEHSPDSAQMVCEDAISRKYISDKVRGWMKHDGYSWGELNIMSCIIQEVEDAPLVQPECKRGEWIHVDPITEAMSPKGWMPWYCSECGSGVGKHKTFFCPSCGADMRGSNP